MTGIRTGTGSNMALQAMLARVNSLARQGQQGQQAIGQLGQTFRGIGDRRDQRAVEAERQALAEQRLAQGDRRLDMAEQGQAQDVLRQREQSVVEGQNNIAALERQKAERDRALGAGSALAGQAGMELDPDVQVTAAEAAPFARLLSQKNADAAKAAADGPTVNPGVARAWHLTGIGGEPPADTKLSDVIRLIDRNDGITKEQKEAGKDAAVLAAIRRQFPKLGLPEDVTTLEQFKAYQGTWESLDDVERNERLDALTGAQAWLKEQRDEAAEGRAVAKEGRDIETHERKMEDTPERRALFDAIGTAAGPMIGLQLAKAMRAELGPKATPQQIAKWFKSIGNALGERQK